MGVRIAFRINVFIFSGKYLKVELLDLIIVVFLIFANILFLTILSPSGCSTYRFLGSHS